MTIGLLNQLHAHKLAQVRARAQKQVESWRETIEVVKRAEQESKCIIALPQKLTNISAIETRIKSVDYMNAMGIENEITRSREQICDFAIEKLGRMHEHLQIEASKLNTGNVAAEMKNNKYNPSNKEINKFAGLCILAYILSFAFLVVIGVNVDAVFLSAMPIAFVISMTFILTNKAHFPTFFPTDGEVANQQTIQYTPDKVKLINNAVTQIEAHRSAVVKTSKSHQKEIN